MNPLNLQVCVSLWSVVDQCPDYTSDIPPEETILALGREVLESTKSWKVGKTYAKGTVQTLSRAKRQGDGAPWHCRISKHTKVDATFDEFWSRLGVNKPEQEKECVSSVFPATFHIHCPNPQDSFLPSRRRRWSSASQIPSPFGRCTTHSHPLSRRASSLSCKQYISTSRLRELGMSHSDPLFGVRRSDTKHSVW